MHIPALYEGAPDFFWLAKAKSFLNLLTVIDNPHNDDALAGTLTGMPFLFTEGDLVDIRLEKNETVPFYEAFELCAERKEKPIDRCLCRISAPCWRHPFPRGRSNRCRSSPGRRGPTAGSDSQ